MLKILAFILTILSGSVAFAEGGQKFEKDGKTFEIESTQKTKMGLLKVVQEEESSDRFIYLDSKLIYPKENSDETHSGWYGLERVYYIDNKMVVLVHNTEGARYGIDQYFFLTISPNKDTVESGGFFANRPEISAAKNVGSQVIIDNINLPTDSNTKDLLRKVVYQNGKITTVESKINNEDKMKSCQTLYAAYQSYTSSGCRNGSGVCGDDAEGCGDYLGKGVYVRVEKAATLACRSRKYLDMVSFKSQVCRLQ